MKICDFTTRELEKLRKECNFTELEMACFDLKAKGKTNVELAMKLNICDSTVSSTMKSVRAKITSVIEQRPSEEEKVFQTSKPNYDSLHPILNYLVDFLKNVLADSPLFPESHTTKEWAEMPDRISVKDKWYAVTDYRTDDDISVPRFKFGDGVTPISKLPFVTAAITDNDVRLWDLQTQISENTQKLQKKQ